MCWLRLEATTLEEVMVCLAQGCSYPSAQSTLFRRDIQKRLSGNIF